jgi:hypothetical protein
MRRGPLGVFVAIVVGVLLVWLTWKLAFARQRITYAVQMTPLVARGSGFTAGLRIFYGSADTPLTRPVVISIRLASRSARDISTAAFDNNKPLAVDLGIPARDPGGPHGRRDQRIPGQPGLHKPGVNPQGTRSSGRTGSPASARAQRGEEPGKLGRIEHHIRVGVWSGYNAPGPLAPVRA